MPEQMTTTIAALAAEIILTRARAERCRKLHLSVLTESSATAPDLPCQWQRKNMFGISFARQDADAARTWLIAALKAGYLPIICIRARAITGGYSPKDIVEMLDPNGPRLQVPYQTIRALRAQRARQHTPAWPAK